MDMVSATVTLHVMTYKQRVYYSNSTLVSKQTSRRQSLLDLKLDSHNLWASLFSQQSTFQTKTHLLAAALDVVHVREQRRGDLAALARQLISVHWNIARSVSLIKDPVKEVLYVNNLFDSLMHNDYGL